jgi:hypothetical protein
MKIMFFIFSLLSFLSVPVYASGGIGWHEIKELKSRECTGPGLGFEVIIKNNHLNPDECKNSNKIQLSCDAKTFNHQVSLVMMAFAANKEISSFVNGCDPEGDAKALTIYVR